MDEETLQLIKDMSNKLDMLGGDADDKSGNSSAAPLAKNTVGEVMAEEAERFASHQRLWEYKWSKTCGFFEKEGE